MIGGFETSNRTLLIRNAGQDRSIPVPLTIEHRDSPIADYGKDFSCIVYPNMNHGRSDEDTGQIYPFLNDVLNWLE